ncbi:MAG: SH3 domain-containing protein [Dehalococcoidia bacterium]|nr:SH3 domain-containing protein [Dehalococcoidia bacterium]
MNVRPLILASLLIAAALLVTSSPARAIESGRDATVHADGDCLRLRATASVSGQVLACLADGTTVSVLPASLNADGFVWRLVSVNGQTGWVVEQYLQQSTAGPAPSTPSGTVSGLLPTAGGGALIVWGGGPLSSLLDRTARQGCPALSLWVTDSSGSFVSYIVGAPDFANGAWNLRYPGGQLPARSPYVAMCAPGVRSEQPALPAPPGSPAISGDLPAAGGFGLVVWGGGGADALVAAAQSRGCDATSVWTNDAAGQFVSYIAGAPAIANAAWSSRFGGTPMPGDSAVVVVCRGRETPASAGGPVGAAGLPAGIPALPPGPAGNR